MKRFLLFAGRKYYAEGGWLDFHSGHDTLEDAINAGRAFRGTKENTWFHVIDTTKSTANAGHWDDFAAQEGEEAYN